MKRPPSFDDPPPTSTDLAKPGPGAELVAHLGDVLRHLAGRAPAGSATVSEAVRADLLQLFEAQATSRWLDVAARRLSAAGHAAHAQACAGHEGNAAVALALNGGDPAALHYRSGAFYLARAAQAGRSDGMADLALGLTWRADQPAGGGRGSGPANAELAILPPSPTVAGHLPRALGLAWTIGRQRRAGGAAALRWPDDAIAAASFGDGTANHAAATVSVNAACWAARQGVPMPLLLLCEDNGLSRSMPTPSGWIRSLYGAREGLRYLYADTAGDPLLLLETARQAVEIARSHRRPVLLHLECVRIGGHAGGGSGPESAYRSADRIAADLPKDPLAATMNALVRTGVLTGEEVADALLDLRDQVSAAVQDALGRPRLGTADEVVAPLAPHRPAAVAMLAARTPDVPRRSEAFGGRLPELQGPLTLAESINRALLDAALVSPKLVLIGRDLARQGGLHGITRGLHRRLGPGRVTDTLQDEQTVLGLALGAAVSGLLPVAEIQNLADLHAAEGQLRNEAATLAFRSGGAFSNPLVIRVPGLGYQDGDGAVAADSGLGMLRDVPGLVIACPAHPSEAPGLLRSCLAAAEADGTLSVFLEPVALYHERDMLSSGDEGWLAVYPAPSVWGSFQAPIGRASVWGSGTDLTIASFGNGLRMSMRAAAELERLGIDCRVLDLRWLAPLPIGDVVREARVSGRLLIVDETRRTGGVSEGLIAGVLEAGFDGRLARVNGHDTVLPSGPAAALVQLSEPDIIQTARALCA